MSDGDLKTWLQKNGSRRVNYNALAKVLNEILQPVVASLKTQRDTTHAEITALKTAHQELQTRPRTRSDRGRAPEGDLMTEEEQVALAAAIIQPVREVLDRMMTLIEMQHTNLEQLTNRLHVLALERLHQGDSNP